jgi:hypothetical protein
MSARARNVESVQWVALVLTAVSAFSVGSLITGRSERRFAANEAATVREHDSAEARAARRFQIRFEAYKAASNYLSKHESWVNFTEPVMTPAPEPPDLSPDEEWVEFGGLIAVTASDSVRDAMRGSSTRRTSSSTRSSCTAVG